MTLSAASPDFPCQTCDVRDKAVCSALNDDELRHLNQITTSAELDVGQMVFLEGDESTYLFNVVSGSLRLTKMLPDGRRQIVGFLFPGDFLGLSFNREYAYTAETLAPTTLCRMPRAGLSYVLERFPKLEHQLLSLASNELAQAQDHLLILGRKSAKERLATVLLMMSERIGHKENDGWLIELPMSRLDLADYIGMTIETVSRTFSQLDRDGVLERPSVSAILLPDLAILASLTGDSLEERRVNALPPWRQGPQGAR